MRARADLRKGAVEAGSRRTAVQLFGSCPTDRAVRVVFGPGTLAQVAAEARTLGNRIMIICGRHEADAAAVVMAQLGDDLAWQIPEVVQHVPVDVAARALAAARGEDRCTRLDRWRLGNRTRQGCRPGHRTAHSCRTHHVRRQ